MTTPTTTHDLAIARAERDAWQSTCEELHRTIAGRDVEIEAHIGSCEAADQRARSFEAALTAEREASKGLVAQVEALRADSRHHAAIAAQNATLASERDAHAAELAAIRDLVAPGNPQGAVVDAVRAMIARWSADERDLRAAIARAEKAEAEIAGALSGLAERLPVTPPTLAAAVDAVREAWDADRSAGARSAAEMMDRLSIAESARAAAVSRAEKAERGYVDVCDAIAAETSGPQHAATIARETRQERNRLRAEVAELTVTRDRLLAREYEDGRLHAQLRAEVAELRARPVLTVEALDNALIAGAAALHGDDGQAWSHKKIAAHAIAALGPVTLPSPDRAEELADTYLDEFHRKPGHHATYDHAVTMERHAAMRRALAKLSPAPAPTFDAAFLRRVLVATKHGPGGKGGPGPCDAACVKCEAERMLADAPAREAAPTDRVLVHADGGDCHGSRVVNGRCVKCGLAPDSQSTELWEPAKVDRIAADHAAAVKVEPTLVAVSDEELRDAYLNDPDDTLSGIRAVRAKLGAAEVTEGRLAGAIREAYGHAAPEFVRAAWNHLRATAAKGG